MNGWNGWAVVDEDGNLMGHLLSDGPILFDSDITAEAWARGLDRESLSSDRHRVVRVRVTAEPQDAGQEGGK